MKERVKEGELVGRGKVSLFSQDHKQILLYVCGTIGTVLIGRRLRGERGKRKRERKRKIDR